MKFPRKTLLTLASVSLLGVTGAFAGPLNWDGSNTGASGGGPGTWNANSNANWWNGAADVQWTDTTGTDTAVFGNTADTVTISGEVTANALQFNTTGYLLSGGTLTLAGTTPGVTVGAGLTGTISSLVKGSAGLTKSGAGTLTLSTANNYSGGTSVTGGTLNVTMGSGTAMPAGGYTVSNASTLHMDFSGAGAVNYPNTTVGAVSIGAGSKTELYADSSKFTAPNSAAVILANVTFSGNGDLNKTGTGSMVINYPNAFQNFTGTLNVNDGILSLQGGLTSTVGNFAVYIASGAKLDLRTDSMNVGTLSGSGNIYRSYSGVTGIFTIGNDNGTGTYSGNFENTVSHPLVKTGTGTQTFTGTNQYTAGTTVSGGRLVTGNTSALGSGAVNVNTADAILQIGDGTVNTVTLGNNASVSIASGAKLALGGYVAGALDGGASAIVTLAGTGGFTFDANATLDLGGFLNLSSTGLTSGTHTYRLFSGGSGSKTDAIQFGGYDSTITGLSMSGGNLTFTAVPEPSTYGLLGAGTLALIAGVRRRRRLAGR